MGGLLQFHRKQTGWPPSGVNRRGRPAIFQLERRHSPGEKNEKDTAVWFIVALKLHRVASISRHTADTSPCNSFKGDIRNNSAFQNCYKAGDSGSGKWRHRVCFRSLTRGKPLDSLLSRWCRFRRSATRQPRLSFSMPCILEFSTTRSSAPAATGRCLQLAVMATAAFSSNAAHRLSFLGPPAKVFSKALRDSRGFETPRQNLLYRTRFFVSLFPVGCRGSSN